MRLLYASDLHGTIPYFEALAKVARRRKPEAILLGGDLFSNSAPVMMGPTAQRQAAEGWFAEWCRAATAPVYWIAGNHEWRHAADPPPAAGTYVGERLVPLGDWDLIGFSFCSPTPYWLLDHERAEEAPNRDEPRGKCYAASGDRVELVEKPRAWLDKRPTLAAMLRELPEPRDWRRTIFMAHNPPFDSGLDTRWGNWPVGSTDIRNFIVAKKPSISLHGHIHEASHLTKSAMHRVGETWGFNPGRGDTGLRALWLDPETPEQHELVESP